MSGVGVTTRTTGLPEHNPKFSTERGKRRHEKRNDTQKKAAESAWTQQRSTQPSRYQKMMKSSN